MKLPPEGPYAPEHMPKQDEIDDKVVEVPSNVTYLREVRQRRAAQEAVDATMGASLAERAARRKSRKNAERLRQESRDYFGGGNDSA